MFFRKKLLRKIFVITVVLLLMVNPTLTRIAFADEIAAEEPATQVTQAQTSAETPLEVTTPSEVTPASPPETTIGEQEPVPQSGITTGDAISQAEVESTANTSLDKIPGEITTLPGDCTPPVAIGETSCLENKAIENDNQAALSDSAGVEATTGENQITGTSGDAIIATGDATASGTIENQVNINTVILEPTITPTSTLEPEVGLEVSPAPKEGRNLEVTNNNEAVISNEAEISASTGKNQASENEGEAKIETGDALAWASLLNLLNVNVVGSNFELLFESIEGQENSDFNFNEIWKELIGQIGQDALVLTANEDSSHLQMLIQNQNEVDLENNIEVSARTGENEANENEKAEIRTGNAAALANAINFANVNILGSKFFFGVINIMGSLEGDLILPRPEYFAGTLQEEVSSENFSNPSVIFNNQNQAMVEDRVESVAMTGGNEEINHDGGEGLVTGDGRASTNTFSLVNLNIVRNNWFFLVINRLGNWPGKVLGWSDPSSSEETVEGSQIFQIGGNEPSVAAQDLQIEENLPSVFENQNQARVKNNILTSASTGENQALGNEQGGVMETGNALSVANLFNFINLNILGGRWFMGVVNVLGDWSGETVFAYPDVVVLISGQKARVAPGEILEYNVSFNNQGYDEAPDASLILNLPKGLVYLDDTSGLTSAISGQSISWNLGNLAVGQGGEFAVQVEVKPDYNFEEEISWFSKLIPQAYAAEEGKEKTAVVNVEIKTLDPESDMGNNSSQTSTTVYQPSTSGTDQRQPVLEISAKNNVNDFVYPGDTVTFEITVKNTSDVPASEVVFTQELFNGVPGGVGMASFKLGTIDPGEGGKLSFGLKLADDGVLHAGSYYTKAKAYGFAPNGYKVFSNEARTNFNLEVKVLTSLIGVQAVEAQEGEVLGESTSVCITCQNEKEILPYVLLLLLSTLYTISWGKTRLRRES